VDELDPACRQITGFPRSFTANAPSLI
jgi:hypothetical protein